MDWLDTLLQGVLLGGLYALFATGLSLTFGVMRLVNLAHGDIIVLASYIALAAVMALGINPLASLAIVIPTMAGLGYLLQRGILNRTLGDDIMPPLLVTFGVSVILQNALLALFSADNRGLSSGDLATRSLKLGDSLSIGMLPLVTLVAAVVVLAALQLLFDRTALGRAFRATADDREAAQLMGVNTRHVFAVAMAIAFTVLAVAGVLFALRTTFTPSIGPSRLLFAFEAVIIGGLGSLWGTLGGGMILGVSQTIGFRLDPGWGVLMGHLVFLAVLVVRPNGLFPRLKA